MEFCYLLSDFHPAMLPPHRFPGLVCGLALLLAAPAGARSPEAIGEETRQALRAAQTIRVEVKQEYAMPEEEVVEMPEEEADKADKPGQEKEGEEKAEATEPAAEKPLENFSLPLAGLAEEAVRLAGWKQVGPDVTAEIILSVEVQGMPVGANYVGSLSGYFYTGAKLRGSVYLELAGQVVTEADISAEIPIAPSVHSSSLFGFRGAPRDAPFEQTLPDYCEAVFTVIGRACGPGPVLAGMKLENDDQRTGAGRALLGVGDASVEPVLIEILGQGDGPMARLAALGLGVHGRATALPALLAALRKDRSFAGQPLSENDGLISSLTAGQEEIIPPAERGSRARELAGGHDAEGIDGHEELHRAVEWALLQIEAPDKLDRLAAALQERDAVMLRRGVAVVLGGLDDERAFPLLAVASRDKEPLVQAAALAALGRRQDERAIEFFLSASDSPTEYVREIAREQLAEAGNKRWDMFLRSQGQTDSASSGIRQEILLVGFKHTDPLVRAAAARDGTYREEPGIRAGLARLVQTDPQAFVREAGVQALAEATDDSNADLLALALGDTDAATRRQAVLGLTRVRTDDEEADKKTARSRLPGSALGPVFALLARQELDEAEATGLLERIEGPGVADKLLQMLPEDHPPAVLDLIARDLARRGEKRAVAPLLALLGKAADPAAGQSVADALVALDDPTVLDPLFDRLKSGTPAARRLALSVLGRLRQARAIGPLIAALRAGEAARAGDPAEGLAGPAREALESLTGKSFATGEDWLRWWKEQAGKPIVLPPPKAVPAETPPEEPADGKAGEPKEN